MREEMLIRGPIRALAAQAALALLVSAGCGGCDPENGGKDPEPSEEVELVLEKVVPSSGAYTGGTEVRLEGEGFLENVADSPAIASLHTAVRFGDLPATGVEVISDTVVRVVAPPGFPGFVSVVVENPNGTASCAACFEYVEEEQPVEPEFEVRVDRITPVRGPAAGGTRARIEGRGFLFGFAEVGEDVRDRTAVLFGDNTSVSFNVIDDRLIEAISPPGNAGDRDVRVQNPNGEALCEGCFHYYVPVSAASIAPDASPVEGGVRVTLRGEGFIEGTVVMAAGRSAISTVVVDDETLTFVTPPAAGPGAADVVVLNPNGRDTLRRRLTYFEEPRLAAVEPPVGPKGGGSPVRLSGAGLAGATEVSFGGVAATELSSAGGDLFVTTPSGEAGAAVDVEVSHPRGTTRLSGAFAYVDQSLRDVTLLNVTPPWGGLEGQETVVLAGTGLDHPSPQVRFGERDAEGVQPIDANRLAAVVPPSASPGPVDVQVRNERGGAMATAAYVYEEALRLESVEPSSGPSSGGTTLTIAGAGFTEDVEVRVGAMFAGEVDVESSSTIVAVTPPGSAGPADVVVRRGAGEGRRTATLPAGFSYREDLVLARIDPSRGAQAGGTYVVLSGAGFTEEAEVSFGGSPAEVMELTGTNLLAVRAPPGDVGAVDVTVSQGEAEVTRPGAYHYYDPASSRGGASGGPMAGTLNVTVADRYSGTPVPGASVMLGSDPDTPFQGETDPRGQITFSCPSLVKEVSVTAWREGFDAVTVSRLDARDLTIFLTPSGGSQDQPQPPPTDMPPPPPVAYINPRADSGSVCGFKLPQGRELGQGEREEARIWRTSRAITSLPPFGWISSPLRVTTDCGHFGLASGPGSVALYAKYGIVSEEVDPVSGQMRESFEPLIMGITRGVEVPAISPPTCTVNRACPPGYTCAREEELDPSNPGSFRWCLCNSDEACGEGLICNPSGGCQEPISAEIVLNMHLDLDVPVQLVNAPSTPDGSERVDSTHAYLELGGDGVVYMGESLTTDEDYFHMESLPRLPADGFVFLTMSTAGGGYPMSVSYRREIGDLASGVSIGPMQPMTRFTSPSGGVLVGGRIQWSYEGDLAPDIVSIQVSAPGFSALPVWRVILPGTETSVSVPPPVMEVMREAPNLEIFIVTALSPRFDFDYFSYAQLALGSWTSFTQDSAFFTVPR